MARKQRASWIEKSDKHGYFSWLLELTHSQRALVIEWETSVGGGEAHYMERDPSHPKTYQASVNGRGVQSGRGFGTSFDFPTPDEAMDACEARLLEDAGVILKGLR
jgi:hypothetical protein